MSHYVYTKHTQSLLLRIRRGSRVINFEIRINLKKKKNVFLTQKVSLM
jgi:hypothetical protein